MSENGYIEIDRVGDAEADQYNVLIVPDEDAPNPLTEFENTWTFSCCPHPRRTLGHERVSREDVRAAINDGLPGQVVYPIYMYEHDAIALSVGNRWGDSEQWDVALVGYAHAPKKEIDHLFGWPEKDPDKVAERATSALKRDLLSYEEYLNGEVYGLIPLARAQCGHLHELQGAPGETAVWGLFGLDYARTRAQQLLDGLGNAHDQEARADAPAP